MASIFFRSETGQFLLYRLDVVGILVLLLRAVWHTGPLDRLMDVFVLDAHIGQEQWIFPLRSLPGVTQSP